MRKLLAAVLLVAAVADAACYRNTQSAYDDTAKTVLKVENQGFDDMNIFVVPEGGTQVRLGMALGKRDSYFDLPGYVVRGGIRALRFVARPIATTRGPISNEITATPGDTLVLTIPPV